VGSDTVKELWPGLMVLDMKGFGNLTKPVVKENSFILMEILMKVIG
jgi:hypothetical protein